MRGHNPEWANLPRRKCDDCGKNYKPKQPLRKTKKKDGSVIETRGFCSDNCRKSYHKHGGAYRKLKVEMQKMVQKSLMELRAEVWTNVIDMFKALGLCSFCHGKGKPSGTGLKYESELFCSHCKGTGKV